MRPDAENLVVTVFVTTMRLRSQHSSWGTATEMEGPF